MSALIVIVVIGLLFIPGHRIAERYRKRDLGCAAKCSKGRAAA